MVKVLIVDDELLVRTTVKLLLDWERNGYHICGEAKDGIDALFMVKECNPDIVLTDVKMPRMGGIELMNTLKVQYPHIKVIILSNYDDYDYVRSALKDGVVDYILKHNLHASTMLDTLIRAKEQLANKTNTFRSLDQNNLLALRNKFTLDLLSGLYREEEIEQRLAVLDIQLDLKNICVIIMSVDGYKQKNAERSMKEISLFNFAILNIIEEILKDEDNGAICHVATEQFVLLRSFKYAVSSSTNEQGTMQVLDRIRLSLKRFLNITVSFSIGPNSRNIVDIKKSYEFARVQMSQKFLKGKNTVIKESSPPHMTNSFKGVSLEMEKSLIAMIHLKDSEKTMMLLNQVFQTIIQTSLDIYSSQMIFNDLISIVNRVCKELQVEIAKVYNNRPPAEAIQTFESIDEARQWFHLVFERLYEALSEKGEKYESLHVNNAILYIDKQYSEDITLESVAQYLKISKVYLSKIFKAHVGVGFMEYLTEMKLKKVSVLLKEGSQDLREIAISSGFHNYPYFFKVFKKRYGVTPKQYIEGQDYRSDEP
ncbi:response regulator transcription factor [Paenibacillus sp. Soil750]|uniref:response regulator transcription factor n=1 Tax=Paenibacillus sp. Soil750 TaxID=1736398 RepID=UPI0006FFD152|nr:response regulator [Paenibacillus sp. Soil750]KRE69762.1 hypothetical protein ASL11_15470 [Paenibacillus sp. Soil750]